MTQTDPAHTSSDRLWQYLLVPGLISGFLHSSGLVLAQGEASVNPIVVSTNISKPKTVQAAPASHQTVAPTAPERVLGVSATLHRQEGVQSEANRHTSDTAPVTSKPQSVSTPESSIDRTPYSIAPSRNQQSYQATPKPSTTNTGTKTATDRNDAYIDPTDYSIGATKGYEPPNAVVLSERSTGCKATLREGQGLSQSLCSAAAIPHFTAQRSDSTVHTWSPPSQEPHWVTAGRDVAPSELPPASVAASEFGNQNPTSVHGPIASSIPAFSGPPGNILPFSGLPGTVSTLFQLPGLSENVGTSTNLLFPLTIPAPITSIFGWRIHPITGDRRFHSGTDLGAPIGTPVLAAYTGQVAVADYMGGYGLAVVLDHNQSTAETLYGHLSQIFVQPGQWVEQGTVIGLVGTTGNSTGPHLHFEIRQLTPHGWVATDPGAQIQYALAQLTQALHIAQAPQQPVESPQHPG